MRRNIVKKTETLLKFFSLITWFPFLSHTWEGGTDTGKRDHKTRKDFWYRRSFSWWSFAWKTAHWTICCFTDIHNHWGFFLAQVEKKMRNLWESNWNKQALKKDRRVALQAAESQSPSGFWLGFSLCVLLFCFVFFQNVSFPSGLFFVYSMVADSSSLEALLCIWSSTCHWFSAVKT